MKNKYPNRIRELRLEAGLTQNQLGGRFKESKDSTVISRWERGVIRPNSSNLIELSEIFGVPAEKILICG